MPRRRIGRTIISDNEKAIIPPRKALRDLGENDHDLLTFDEAGGRLQCEIDRAATLVADLQKTDDATGIQRAKDRLAALKEPPAGLVNIGSPERIPVDSSDIPPRWGQNALNDQPGAGRRPRTSLPGRAAVGTPSSAMTSPLTTVTTYPLAAWSSRRPPDGRSLTTTGRRNCSAS